MNFEEALATLNNQQYNKYTLSKHLGELLITMAREQPADPLGSFEEMSSLLWKQRHVQNNQSPPSVPTDELDKCTATLELLDELNNVEARSKVDMLFFDMKDKWANYGITMNQDTALMLQCSMIRLSAREDIKSLRFWGIFNSPAGNIYVSEADVDPEKREDDQPTVGPYDIPAENNVGVNRFVYFVTKSPYDDWVRLPDLRPSDIINSRKVTWQISGDLSAALHPFDAFDVTEDIYIRTLISRITSATMLAPNGYVKEYEPEEEEEQNEPEPEEEEEGKEPPPKPLRLVLDPDFEPVEIDNVEWVHIRPFILQQGRETYKKAPKPPKQPKEKKAKRVKTGEGEEEEEEEEQPEEEAAEEEEEEPEEGVELFGSIENDEGFGEDIPCWNMVTRPSVIEGEGITVSESLRWPGAYNLTDGKKCCSVYWGAGTKFVVNGFQPPAPPNLATEFKKKMTESIDPTIDQEKEVERLKNPPKEEEEEEEDQGE